MADLNSLILERPELQPYLQIPELRSLFETGLKSDPPWSSERFYSGVIGSQWYKTHTQQQRRWITLTEADKQREVGKSQADVLKMARQSYWLNWSDNDARWWGGLLASGDATPEQFEAFLREDAMKRFPAFSEQIGRGATVATLFAHYINTAAEELEQPAESISGDTRIFDPLLRSSSTGELPSHTEFIQHVRGLAEWRNTGRAKQMASDWELRLARIFGKAAI